MLGRQLRNFIDWLGEKSELVLAAMLCVVLGTWGFAWLLGEVKDGDTGRFDTSVMHAIQRFHGPHYGILEEIGRDFTALGGIAVLTVVTLAVAGFLFISRKFAAMWLVIIATVGGLLLSGALKALTDRPRPDIGEKYSLVMTSSFPSGHSMMSAVVYLTLGSLLARLVERRRLKFYFLFVAVVLTFLVGVSRVYMGVHWPTDVLAGWTAGLVWAILCWLVARYLQNRGTIETDAEISREDAENDEVTR